MISGLFFCKYFIKILIFRFTRSIFRFRITRNFTENFTEIYRKFSEISRKIPTPSPTPLTHSPYHSPTPNPQNPEPTQNFKFIFLKNIFFVGLCIFPPLSNITFVNVNTMHLRRVSNTW